MHYLFLYFFIYFVNFSFICWHEKYRFLFPYFVPSLRLLHFHFMLPQNIYLVCAHMFVYHLFNPMTKLIYPFISFILFCKYLIYCIPIRFVISIWFLYLFLEVPWLICLMFHYSFLETFWFYILHYLSSILYLFIITLTYDVVIQFCFGFL